MSIVKILTCGSVDDGKSTLIGRIMYETENVFIDQSEYLKKMMKIQDDQLDFSLLLDGLLDEKDQKITIDAAFKYLTVDNKNFIFIDSPGHKEYTKNMAYASSFANLAILLVDAEKGLTEQTKNHLLILSHLKNVSNVIVCVNKIDLINYNYKSVEKIKKSLIEFVKNLEITLDQIIPISAKYGDNISTKSKKFKNYNGPTLISYLKKFEPISKNKLKNTILSIQFQEKIGKNRIYASYQDFGGIRQKDKFINLLTNEEIVIKEIFSNFKKKNASYKSSNIMFTTTKEKSISKGDILAKNSKGLFKTDSFKANIVWCAKSKVKLSTNYLIKFQYQESLAFFSNINKEFKDSEELYTTNVELFNKLVISDKNSFKKFSNFLVIDPVSFESVGIGVVNNTLDKGAHIIDTQLSSYGFIKNNQVIWFTGLSGSGKTTIGNELGKILKKNNIPFYIIDGDNIRQNLNKDLGFSENDRSENNRRIANIASILSDVGVVPIVTTISPLESIRKSAMNILKEKNVCLVYLNTDLETCIERSSKNLYNKKFKKSKNVTGIDQIYEIPKNPDIVIDTTMSSPINSANTIYLKIFT